MQLATGSQSRGSNEPPAQEPLAIGSNELIVEIQLSVDYGSDEGAEDSDFSDEFFSVKTLPQASSVKQSASPPASGGDESDESDTWEGPLNQVAILLPPEAMLLVHRPMAVNLGQFFRDFWYEFVDPLIDYFHYHETVRLQQVSKDANAAIYRSLIFANGWRPRD